MDGQRTRIIDRWMDRKINGWIYRKIDKQIEDG